MDRIWMRILALVLVVALIGGSTLSYLAQIRVSGLDYVGSVLESAYSVTSDGTGYLSEPLAQRCMKILKNVLGKPKRYEDYDRYASVAIAQGDYEKAIEYMQGCVDTYQGDSQSQRAQIYLRLGSLYVLHGDFQEALPRFDSAIECDPDMTDAYLLRAQINNELGNSEACLEDMLQYVSLAGENAVVRGAIGGLYEQAAEYGKAIECYSLAIDQVSDESQIDVDLLKSRARCKIMAGQSAEAIPDLNWYFALGGRDDEGVPAAMLSACCMEAQDYEQAVKMARRAVSDGYNDPLLLYAQTIKCAYILQDYEGVVSDGAYAAKLAEEQGLNPAEYYYWMAMAHFTQTHYEDALELFRKTNAVNPKLTGLQYYIGVCCMVLEDYMAAVEAFTKSIQRQEEISSSLYNRSLCYFQLEEVENGLTDLQAVLQRDDDPTTKEAATSLLEALLSDIPQQTDQPSAGQ